MLPPTAGETFLHLLSKELEALIKSLKQFIGTIHNIVTNKCNILINLYLTDLTISFLYSFHSGKLDSCLISTGIIWEFCDKLPTLPINNAEAVISVLCKEEQLVNDAIEELDAEVSHQHLIY